MVTPTLKPIAPEESEKLIRLAEEIWLPAFAPYFDGEKLKALFTGMYHPDLIRRQLTEPKHEYRFIFCSAAAEYPDGYCATLNEGEAVRIDKVYVRENLRGRGVGSAVMHILLADASAAGKSEASLRVNRQNTAAIRLYRRMGFSIVAEEDFPGPDGHIYNDFVMLKKLDIGRG